MRMRVKVAYNTNPSRGTLYGLIMDIWQCVKISNQKSEDTKHNKNHTMESLDQSSPMTDHKLVFSRLYLAGVLALLLTLHCATYAHLET